MTPTPAATEIRAPQSTDATIVGVYDDLARGERAIEELTRAGISRDRVSLIGTNLQSETTFHGYVNTGDVAKGGAAIGAWVGGIFGLLAGFAALFIPGVGPVLVLGPLAAAAVGAAEGAAGAGILGALLGVFVSKQHIPKFTEYLKAGKYLVLVHGTPEDVQRASQVLRSTGAQDLTERQPGTAA